MSPDRIRPGEAARRRADAKLDGSPQEIDVHAGTPSSQESPGSQNANDGGLPEIVTPDWSVSGQADNADLLGDSLTTAGANSDSGIAAPLAANVVGDGKVSTDSSETDRSPRHRPRFWHRLYYGETNTDFVRRRGVWFTISSILILAGVISLATRGLDLGIDFVGGTSWQVRTSTVTVNEARTALTPLGFAGATITILGSNPTTKTLQVEAKLGNGASSTKQAPAEVDKVIGVLAHLAHVKPSAVSYTEVGPSWGSSVTSKAIEALIVFFILVSLYISVFFEWRMALGAVIAVAHDVMVVIGIYSLTGLEVTPDTVVAVLTILGYSLYDTIVVFDRVRDNVKGIGGTGKITISDIVNLSMNQTLARSINTSLVAILPILSVLILGADILGAQTLQYFGWALLIGLLSGAYSSIFIASPIVAALKEREPRYKIIREKLAARGLDRQLLSASALAAGALGVDLGGAPIRRAPQMRQSQARPPAKKGTGRTPTRQNPRTFEAPVEFEAEGTIGARAQERSTPSGTEQASSGSGARAGASKRPASQRPASRSRRKGRRR